MDDQSTGTVDAVDELSPREAARREEQERARTRRRLLGELLETVPPPRRERGLLHIDPTDFWQEHFLHEWREVCAAGRRAAREAGKRDPALDELHTLAQQILDEQDEVRREREQLQAERAAWEAEKAARQTALAADPPPPAEAATDVPAGDEELAPADDAETTTDAA